MQYIALFSAAFFYVMLRAFQQRNVAFNNYGWIWPTSYGMAAIDMYCVISFAKNGWQWQVWLAYGTAGAMGAVCAMLFHNRYIKK